MSEFLESIINGSFFMAIIEIILQIIVVIINILIWPFGLLIKSILPDIDQAMDAIADYFDLAGTYISWLLNALAIPPVVISLVVGYYIFAFTVTFGAWLIKLLIKWKQALWG